MRKIILLLIAVVFFIGYEFTLIYKEPTSCGEKAIDIPAHASLRRIASLLHDEGVLQNKWTMVFFAKITGAAHRVQSGEFMFHTPSSPKSALEILLHGTVVLHKVTIPEGSTVADMAPWFEEAKIISKDEFIKASRDPKLLEQLGVPSDRIEGYLFPSTYLFPKREKVKKIFEVMMGELQKNLTPEDRSKAAAFGWNLHQWITFASVVEKETGNQNEHVIVSSVFHNRLNKGMKLQSDPTVIYGIENYDGNIHKKDLLTDTPYNTYTRKGLPIGPVANPGADALHASVNPATTDYLYFVGNGQGVHIFSKTYEEHNKAVKKFQVDPFLKNN